MKQPPTQTEQRQLERSLPSNIDAERACLGGVLLDNRLAHELFTYVMPSDFYSPLNRRYAEAIQAIHKRAGKIDPIVILEEMKKTGAVETDVATITNLSYGLPHFTTLKVYIDIILEKSLARQTIRELQNGISSLLEEDEEVDSIISKAISELISLRDRTSVERYKDVRAVAGEVRAIFEQWQEGNSGVTSVSTGIPELDQKLKMKGIAFGELTLIAARPSIGKTALILQICKHVAKLGVPVLFITLEMAGERLVMRMLPAVTGIPNKSINPYTVKNMEAERAKLFAALDTFDFPLYFDTQSQLEKLIANAEHMILTLGIKLVAVDYFGLINRGAAAFKDSFSRVSSLGDTAMALKALASRNNVASLVAIQLSRDIEREYRKPRMSDVRDSGEIEAAADCMIFPYDPEARFHSQNPELIQDSIWLHLQCEKQRDGERGWHVPVEYNKDEQTFTSELMSGRSAPQPHVPVKNNDVPPPRNWHEREEDEPDFA